MTGERILYVDLTYLVEEALEREREALGGADTSLTVSASG